MAEFNIFLGTAKKSVGDVTLMRRNGKQIARVRLRTIANPRSEAQATQRNFVAPVTRFFAPLRKTLRCSFEGLNRDLSYNQFQRINIKLAQANGWYLTKGAQFTPMPYQLSRGRLASVAYAIENYLAINALFLPGTDISYNTNKIADISQYFISVGYKAGDVVTTIIINRADDGSYYPVSSQFVINPNDQRTQEQVLGSEAVYAKVSGRIFAYTPWMYCAAGAIIVSRYDDGRWLRSTQFLAVDADIVSWLQSDEQRAAAIESYQVGGSDSGGGVYPGGSDEIFNVAARDGRALLFVGGQVVSQIVTVDQLKCVKVKPDNLDDYYYIIKENTYALGTNAAGSNTPSDWRFLGGSPADVTESNSIAWVEGNTIDQWLRTCGYTGA